MKKHIYLLAILFLMGSCDHRVKDVDVSAIKTDLKISRVDLELSKCETKQEVHELLLKNKGLVNGFLYFGIFPSVDIMENDFLTLAKDSVQGPLFDAVAEEFGDITDIEQKVSELFRHIKYYYPTFSEPTLYMIMSGFGGFDVNYFDSTSVVLGMENFLTDKTKYYPRREVTPYYMLKHYTRGNIPSKLSNMFAQFEFVDFNKKDKSLVNRMIYWGKVYYFSEMMLPTTADSTIMEYSTDEILRLESNKAETYNYFVANDLLFNEERAAERKFLGPRPTTNEVGDEAPGRIGQYLGWDIVRAYMQEHPEVTLPELLADVDHQKIFRLSRYKPKPLH